ncbi:hypothetical protein EDB81DRAFT_774416 [Dactylonectria macrodidyma]|uniref:Mid2 domain-containing protein n=1 Tax=Dactylonectria macrodidyma TaxID=307937 RepID=A0A9P9JGB2_9HYPO|nr:hypothetical protein EDB81DRAFT_774416 [Dactylonectria macrodidyma]
MAIITAAPPSQSIAARQEAHVIIQTLTWEHTTFTTHVTLSGSQPTDSTTVVTEHHESSGGLTNAQVGAIVGSLVGFFVLVMIIICCCRRRPPPPPPRRHGDRRSYGSYSSSYFTDDTPEPWPPKGQYRRTPKPATPRMMPPQQMPPQFMPPQFIPPMTPRSTRSHRSFVQRPPPVVERIPGGPKFPTYRAIPIPNPRRPTVPHVP